MPANCHDLNQAAIRRIKQYTNTVGVDPKLLHTELAVKTIKDSSGNIVVKAFRDYDVHRVLTNSNIKKKSLHGSTSKEWFSVDLQTALKAIEAVKKNQPNIGNMPINDFVPIVFRPEQEEAIKKTVKQFKNGNRMLWNAKMRFGKTLSALQVIKECGFKKTIIITHRPVVDAGWFEDFKKIFSNREDYEYGSKNNGSTVEYLLSTHKNFVYFASIQDLRGSAQVNGKFEKNTAVFETNWDFVIVDEAHEGITTALGNDVIKNIVKEESGYDTKFLALSGMPFNILNDYDDNIYTWDYVMEQRCKRDWDIVHFGDSNPYDELPELKIYTYDLGKIIGDKRYVELEDKAFNFREFFRTWTGNLRSDRKEIPEGKVIGDFYHEDDVRSFLNLITKESKDSCYPYSSEEYRKLFKHSLWMVPGVKKAKALQNMMNNHPVFGSSAFEIVNVAGDGDKDEESKNALELVRKAIKNAGDDGYTITLSCGKLTTGVTIPEWTAVFMLAGSYSTSAANYLQTIFRVQSPCNINGKIKQYCYVFDFAPDRTLKMVAESVALSTKAGKTSESDKRILGEFLNYCPVIAVDGTEMKSYDTNRLLQQLKRAYADRAVQNGFDDVNLYNDELLKLDELDIEKFNKLKGIVGASKAAMKSKDIDINHQGFTDEEYEEVERIQKKPKRERTPEEEARLAEVAEKKKQKNSAISILRGISIRIPLLIYGADIDFDEDITMEKLVDLVDDSSWKEFMPAGVTKQIFTEFTKYYDRDVFIAARKRIRKFAASADRETPTRRVIQIVEIFRHFKNPDKETVLTPWRVVNMHMSDTIGGWCFFNEKFEDDTQEEKHRLEEPRFVDRGDVTYSVFGEDAHILEINSKTGLYPLYVAYSSYKQKMEGMSDDDWEPEECQLFWNETIQNNVFVICKTPMAKSITRRTLCGYSDAIVNAHYFDDLVNMLKNKPEQFKKRVLKGSYWKKDVKEMKFDAVVGNPPYQGKSENTRKPSIYPLFYDMAFRLSRYATLISPARFLFNVGDTSKDWNYKMLNDEHFKVVNYFPNSQDVFTTVEIKGGVAITVRDADTNFGAIGTFTKSEELQSILRKVISKQDESIMELISSRGIYRFTDEFFNDFPDAPSKLGKGTGNMIASNVFARVPNAFNVDKRTEDSVRILGLDGRQRAWRWIERRYIQSNEYLDSYNVVLSKVNGSGQFGEALTMPLLLNEGEGATDTFISIGIFKTSAEAENMRKYIMTKFARAMLGVKKVTQDNPRHFWQYVPSQDFTNDSDIDWTQSVSDIDKQLYSKYGLTAEEIKFLEDNVKSMDGLSYYESLLKLDYNNLVQFLLQQYGKAKHNYFKDTNCTTKNPQVTRTSEGLYCHHIDEDKAIMLSNDKFAAANPFEYQKANRLVYCNLLEHLLLHVKIAENPNAQANENELPGIGGAINFICKDLNDIYAGKEFTDDWRKTVAEKVKDNFDDYIAILRYLWNVIESNPIYKAIITKDMLCVGWDGKVVKEVMNALNDGE